MTGVALLILVLLAAGITSSHADLQGEPTLVFEVASIRPNTSGPQEGGGGGPRPGGRYVYSNVLVRTLISIAFEIPAQRIVNLPSWTAENRYDIQAVGKDKASAVELAHMVRALLTERFHLRTHREQRAVAVYLLVRSRADSSFGPGLRPTTLDCLSPADRKIAAERASASGRPTCAFRFTDESLTSASVTIPELLPVLTSATGRIVLDRTELDGRFEVELKWASLPGQQEGKTDSVSIYTAVREQLGLRLVDAREPLDVVVVDGIERPSEN